MDNISSTNPKTAKIDRPRFRFLKGLFGAAKDRISKISTDTLGWTAILLMHSATVPTLLAVMGGLTDRMPPLDLVLLVWAGLTLMFVKAAVQKDMLNVVTIGLGFVLQAVMVALIFFK